MKILHFIIFAEKMRFFPKNKTLRNITVKSNTLTNEKKQTTNKQKTTTAKSSKKQAKFKIQAEPWNTSNYLESELFEKKTYPSAWNLEWRSLC